VEWIVGKEAQRGRKEGEAVGEAEVDDDDPMTMSGRLTNFEVKVSNEPVWPGTGIC